MAGEGVYVSFALRCCRTVDEVDLFPAAISERRVDGGLVGPTFACLLARQFSDLRRGDRYWYENSGPFRFSQGILCYVRAGRVFALETGSYRKRTYTLQVARFNSSKHRTNTQKNN